MITNYCILALDYFALGDADGCVEAINVMLLIVGLPDDYEFTDWSGLAAKIEEMIEMDPS